MNDLIPFDSAKLPVRRVERMSINADVVRSADYPSISIKGKQFTIVRDGVKQIMMKPDDPDEVAQSIQVVVLRANTHARVFYAKAYVEGESDGAKPACFSFDGVKPDSLSDEPQANKCAICKHAVWGSKLGQDGKPTKGTACSPNARIAVAAPDKLDDPFLMRVPPASLNDKVNNTGFKDIVKIAKARGLEYNEIVMKIAFDREAPSPKLTFRPVGVLPDAVYEMAKEQYNSEVVVEIVGVTSEGDPVPKAAPADEITDALDALDAALAAREATRKAATKEAAPEAAAPKKPAAKPAPSIEDALDEVVAAPAKAEKKAEAKPSNDSLLDDLDSLLGSTDD